MNKNIPPKYSKSISELPSDISVKIKPLIEKMMKKIDPELKEIVKIFKEHSIEVDFQFEIEAKPHNDTKQFLSPIQTRDFPKQSLISTHNLDLIGGIKKILDIYYPNSKNEILGVIYEKSDSVASDIAKILEAARLRDKYSLIKELEVVIAKLK